MITWKDYTGPNLSALHSREGVQLAADLIEEYAPSRACCQDEKKLRILWAVGQNAKSRLVAYDLERQVAADGPGVVRTFTSGANRDKDDGKLDYDGFLSPLVLEAYATYMNFNRSLADGSTRASDNWQKGIPKDVYIKSLWRHFFDVWKFHRGGKIKGTIVWAACGVLFNVMGYLHEWLKEYPGELAASLEIEEYARLKLRSKVAAPQAQGKVPAGGERGQA